MESIHYGIKYECNLCDHKAGQNAHLKAHIESIHLGRGRAHKGNQYLCDQCDYRAIYKSALKSHMESTHIGIK